MTGQLLVILVTYLLVYGLTRWYRFHFISGHGWRKQPCSFPNGFDNAGQGDGFEDGPDDDGEASQWPTELDLHADSSSSSQSGSPQSAESNDSHESAPSRVATRKTCEHYAAGR